MLHRPRQTVPERPSATGTRSIPEAVPAVSASAVPSFRASGATVASLDQVSLRVGQDQVAHGFMVPNVPGAAAQMPVQSLGDGLFEGGARHLLSRETLQQNLRLVHEARCAIAALEGKRFDKRLLQRGQLAVLGMAFDSPNGFAVEANRRPDTGRVGPARPIGI